MVAKEKLSGLKQLHKQGDWRKRHLHEGQFIHSGSSLLATAQHLCQRAIDVCVVHVLKVPHLKQTQGT